MRIDYIVTKKDNYYIAECTTFFGCTTQGKTYEEAIRNLEIAMNLWLKEDEEKFKERNKKNE